MKRWVLLGLALCISSVVAQTAPNSGHPLSLTGLNQQLFLQLLIQRSVELQYSQMNTDVSRHLMQGEAGLYETVSFMGVRNEGRVRQRTAMEQAQNLSTAGVANLDETGNTNELGIRNRLPSGGEISLSYKILSKTNNLIPQYNNGQYDTEHNAWLNLTLKQPLLRNRGREVTETDRRVAALEYDITLHQLRQQLLKISIDGLNLYWQLYRAEKTLQLRKNTLINIEAILTDTQERIAAGKLPATAVLDVQTVLLSRQAEVTRSEYAVQEAQSKLATALNVTMDAMQDLSTKPQLRGRDVALPVMDSSVEQVLETWPPFQIAKIKYDQAKIRLRYAQNQMLPLFDLVLAYNGTGYSYDAKTAISTAEKSRFPDWYVGVNIEVPLQGNRKATQQFLAQNSRLSQAELEILSITTAFANDLKVRHSDLLQSRQVLISSQEDLALRQTILNNERQRFQLGVGLLGNLLQKQIDVLDAEQRLLENEIRYEFALVTWQYTQGSLLADHQIDIASQLPILQ
jgi:outer membrane protein TolC